MNSTTHHNRHPRLRLAAATLAVVSVDQTAKFLAEASRSPVPGLDPVRNPALSLSLISGGRWAETAAMLVGLAFAAAVVVPRVRRGTIPSGWAALALGGAAANLLDRALLGAVRDFVPAGPVVFNLADLAVVAGLGGILLTLVRRRLARTGQPSQAPKGLTILRTLLRSKVTAAAAGTLATTAWVILETAPPIRW